MPLHKGFGIRTTPLHIAGKGWTPKCQIFALSNGGFNVIRELEWPDMPQLTAREASAMAIKMAIEAIDAGDVGLLH